jgi:hypothetical protein
VHRHSAFLPPVLAVGLDHRDMVRSYLRHGETSAFGLVCSASSNSLYDGALAFVPALEDVLVWDVKRGEQVRHGV